ncbi:hypothetical protein Tco_0711876 [Tanacetum coccineum]
MTLPSVNAPQSQIDVIRLPVKSPHQVLYTLAIAVRVRTCVPSPSDPRIVAMSNDDNSSSDDDSTYGEDIEYVDASPPDVRIGQLRWL